LQIRNIGDPGAIRLRPEQVDMIFGDHCRCSIVRANSRTMRGIAKFDRAWLRGFEVAG
jgi:hypothetical protein